MILALTTKYEFWIKQGKNSFRLPVNPEEIIIDNSAKNTSVEIDGLGETTIIQSPNPLKFSFEFELPAAYYSGCSYSPILSPDKSYQMLDTMKNTSYVQFIVTGTRINHRCTVENLSYKESGGDVGTYIVKISLKQYFEPSARKVTIVFKKEPVKEANSTPTPTPAKPVAVVQPAPRPSPPPSAPPPRTYKVQGGDTLWKIARNFYGDGNKYTTIYNANRDKISNPNLIYVGQVLIIP